MHWYTNSKGKLCVGMDSADASPLFKVETDIKTKTDINLQLTEEHIQAIGSYPEDWSYDQHISDKITAAARLIFEEKLKAFDD